MQCHTKSDRTWYNRTAVSLIDNTPSGALRTRKTNITYTAGPVSFGAVNSYYVGVGLKADSMQCRLSCEIYESR